MVLVLILKSGFDQGGQHGWPLDDEYLHLPSIILQHYHWILPLQCSDQYLKNIPAFYDSILFIVNIPCMRSHFGIGYCS